MASGHTEVGEARINIFCDEAAGVIHFVESVSGVFERATAFTLRSDSTGRPLSSHTVFGREPRLRAVRLQYDETSVTGQIEQPAEYGGFEEINCFSGRVTHDFFAVPHLLRGRLLRVHETHVFPIFDFRQRRIVAARAWVAKMEPITVPAGKFNCFRIEGFSGKLRWIVWIDEKFPHRIAKQIFPGMEVEFDLVEFKPAAGAAGEAPRSSSQNLH